MVSATAHHSFASAYEMSKEITITGTIVGISLRSPHSFFFVENEDAKGATQRWAVEGAAASQFEQRGITKDTLKIGDAIEIIGNPARGMKSNKRIRLIKMTRPADGWSWGYRPGEIVQ